MFLGQAGNEYDNAKAVYLSPQIAGFDFGIQYAPNTSNGNGIGSDNIAPFVNSLQGSGTGTGNSCAIANTGCPTLSSGPGIQDGSRSINQAAIGARYQGQFGATGLLAYVVGEGSQHANYTGPTTAAVLGNTSVPGSKFNGSYNDLAIGSAGIAATFAGFTVGGNVVGGQMNGQLGLQPKGGAPLVGILARREVCGRAAHGRHRRRGVLAAGQREPVRHQPVAWPRRSPSAAATPLRPVSPHLANISGATSTRALATSSPARSEQRRART